MSPSDPIGSKLVGGGGGGGPRGGLELLVLTVSAGLVGSSLSEMKMYQ